ncbi:unnamed protein product [Closterium sp. NIES-64]|nr:unnamed protein product [Closterium sp. NIES-64]
MDATMAAALLSVKALLGVSFTDWAVSSPCAVQGVAAPPGAWSNVLCDSIFKPISLHGCVGGMGAWEAWASWVRGRHGCVGGMGFLGAWVGGMGAWEAWASWVRGRHGLPAWGYLGHNYFDFNWFSASIPSALVGITSLTSFGASYNYLYGPVPKLGTALKTIDVQKNWLSVTFPGTGFLSCSASSNCFANIGACNTTGTTQRPLDSCAVCDSLKGTDPIYRGGTCAPNTAGPLATFTTPTTSSPILPRFCVGVPLSAAQAAILLTVKTALGVTFTEWSASTIAAKASPLTSEISNGPKALKRRRLAASEAGRERVLLVAPPSAQAGLCTIQGQMPVPGSWPGLFCSSAGNVVGLHLSSNLFFQRLDSFVAPILPTASLKDMAVSFNWLYGSVPSKLVAMAALSNLLVLSQKKLGLCRGGTCLPVLSPSLAKVPNSADAATLTMTCAAVPLDATSVVALLKVGAALGVRDIDWRNGSKCNIEGQGANPKSFPGVWCSANGTVLNITLPNKALRGIIHADISKLTALSYLDLSYNLFFGQLSKFVSNMLPLPSLATLNLNSNYLYDSIPSALVNMPKLTELRVGANYLTGTLPAMVLQLQVLAIASNLLAGAFPSRSFQLCDIRSNCLSSPGSCTNDAGVAQRNSGCAFCGSATGTPPFCAGTTCTPDVAALLAAGTVNNLTSTLPAMFCEAVAVDENSGLGVSASSWAVDSPCTLAGNAPAVDSWTGVVCDLSGQVLSLCVRG